MRALKNFLRRIRMLIAIFKKEFRDPSPLSILKRIKYLYRGFLSYADSCYNFVDYSLDDYISNWSEMQMLTMYDKRNIQAGYQFGFNNKIFAAALLGPHFRTPKVFAIIEKGKPLSLTKPDSSILSETWLETCQNSNGKILFKPVAGAGGSGIFLFSVKDGSLYQGDKKITEKEATDIVTALDEYIITEYLVQGSYGNSLYPETTNTIRVLTAIEPETGEPFIAYAAQRVGRECSRPVDNFSKGGIFSEINLESGELGPFGCFTDEMEFAWIEKHPDTNNVITGLKVPHWDEFKNSLLEGASSLQYMKSLAWDIVVLDDCIAVIEADAYGVDQDLVPRYPLLKDERMRKFFEYHKLTRKRIGLW